MLIATGANVCGHELKTVDSLIDAIVVSRTDAILVDVGATVCGHELIA